MNTLLLCAVAVSAGFSEANDIIGLTPASAKALFQKDPLDVLSRQFEALEHIVNQYIGWEKNTDESTPEYNKSILLHIRLMAIYQRACGNYMEKFTEHYQSAVKKWGTVLVGLTSGVYKIGKKLAKLNILGALKKFLMSIPKIIKRIKIECPEGGLSDLRKKVRDPSTMEYASDKLARFKWFTKIGAANKFLEDFKTTISAIRNVFNAVKKVDVHNTQMKLFQDSINATDEDAENAKNKSIKHFVFKDTFVENNQALLNRLARNLANAKITWTPIVGKNVIVEDPSIDIEDGDLVYHERFQVGRVVRVTKKEHGEEEFTVFFTCANHTVDKNSIKLIANVRDVIMDEHGAAQMVNLDLGREIKPFDVTLTKEEMEMIYFDAASFRDHLWMNSAYGTKVAAFREEIKDDLKEALLARGVKFGVEVVAIDGNKIENTEKYLDIIKKLYPEPHDKAKAETKLTLKPNWSLPPTLLTSRAISLVPDMTFVSLFDSLYKHTHSTNTRFAYDMHKQGGFNMGRNLMRRFAATVAVMEDKYQREVNQSIHRFNEILTSTPEEIRSLMEEVTAIEPETLNALVVSQDGKDLVMDIDEMCGMTEQQFTETYAKNKLYANKIKASFTQQTPAETITKALEVTKEDEDRLQRAVQRNEAITWMTSHLSDKAKEIASAVATSQEVLKTLHMEDLATVLQNAQAEMEKQAQPPMSWKKTKSVAEVLEQASQTSKSKAKKSASVRLRYRSRDPSVRKTFF